MHPIVNKKIHSFIFQIVNILENENLPALFSEIMIFSFIQTVQIVIGEFTRIRKTENLSSSDVM